ncbi:MAG: SixA phosphatase family protein [Crocinitomicaceae bacterium]
MKLYLLRHAKTNQQSPTGKDFDRRLLPKGHAQCALMQKHLQGANEVYILCSSAQRTRETLEGIDLTIMDIEFRDDLYLCSRDTLLKAIWECKSDKDLMIIGHNFGISDLAEYLLEDYIEMRTCELLVFNFEIDTWQEVSKGLGDLIDRYRPVPKGF